MNQTINHTVNSQKWLKKLQIFALKKLITFSFCLLISVKIYTKQLHRDSNKFYFLDF